MSYGTDLQDPRWQKLRLQVMERDDWRCRKCRSDFKPLNVHHTIYRPGFAPWNYPADELLTLCADCHKNTHADPPPKCADCGVTLTDANYGGSRGDGKTNDAARGLGLCQDCCELLEIAR